MEWTDHGHNDAMMTSYDDMPGMASDADLQKLRDASGREAEILFLQLMIEHHKGGVEMAEAVLPLTEREEVTYLADTIVAGQQAEIATMEDMLAARSCSKNDAFTRTRATISKVILWIAGGRWGQNGPVSPMFSGHHGMLVRQVSTVWVRTLFHSCG
jgi:hypothetical protein